MRKRAGVLMIHGLMGSPREFMPLEAALGEHGFVTRSLTLPGHGASPSKSFAKTSVDEFLEHCLAEYHALAEQVDEAFILGHSLGGICTLLTAAERPAKLKGVIALSTPYEHAYLFNRPHGWLEMRLDELLPAIGYVPECKTGFERPDYRFWMLPKLLRQTGMAFSKIKRSLHRVDVPVCLAHSRYDLTIPYKEMEKLTRNIGSRGKVITHTLARCGHQVFPHSRDRDEAIHLVLRFLTQDCERLHGQGGKLERAGHSA